MVRLVVRASVFTLLLVIARLVLAQAPLPSFQIKQVFSNIDGSLQFVELTETAGQNGQSHFAGLVLTSTHGNVIKTYVFPHDFHGPDGAPFNHRGGSELPVVNASSGSCCHRPTFLIDQPPIPGE